MTQEEKELLLTDLTARLHYRVCARQYYSASEDDFIIEGIIGEQIYAVYNSKISMTYPVKMIKPYLRPMSSMTEEEVKEFAYRILQQPDLDAIRNWQTLSIDLNELSKVLDWLNKKQFDYRGLIPLGLALEAPEGMYSIKTTCNNKVLSADIPMVQ